MSKIEWTDTTWNPVRGCSRVSQGCVNCYAERQAIRHAGPGGSYEGLVRTVNGHPTWTGQIRLVAEKLDEPLHWKRPRRVFVNSMSDLFHEGVPFEFIASAFAVMGVTSRHTYQILTKRPQRMLEFFRWAHRDGEPDDDRIFDHWPQGVPWEAAGHHRGSGYDNCGPNYPYPNVWLGVSIEDQATADERIPLLLETPAVVRFVSYEPALGPVDFRHLQPGDPPTEIDALNGRHGVIRPHRGICSPIDWLIVGGESGPGARPCAIEWLQSAVRQCRTAGVPVFVKQMGAYVVSEQRRVERGEVLAAQAHPGGWAWRAGLRDRKGGDPDEWPESLRVREWPLA